MRHLGAPLAGTASSPSLHTPCSLSGFFLFLFLFMLPMFTRSTTFCWSSTNHQAFCLRFVCVFSFSPSSTLQRLISHVVVVLVLVLVVVAGVLRFLFRYAYTAVFDFCVCGSLCAGKTCSHAVHLNFLCPVPCSFPLAASACTPSTCVAFSFFFFLLTRFCCFSQLTHFKNA